MPTQGSLCFLDLQLGAGDELGCDDFYSKGNEASNVGSVIARYLNKKESSKTDVFAERFVTEDPETRAAVKEALFSLENGVLRFHHAPPPSAGEVAALVSGLRRAVLRRMLHLRAVPAAIITDLLAWPHSWFSLDAGTLVLGTDRAGLTRLLRLRRLIPEAGALTQAVDV